MCLEKVLPLIVAILYGVTGLLYLRKGNVPACGVWISYAVANVFLVMMSQE